MKLVKETTSVFPSEQLVMYGCCFRMCLFLWQVMVKLCRETYSTECILMSKILDGFTWKTLVKAQKARTYIGRRFRSLIKINSTSFKYVEPLRAFDHGIVGVSRPALLWFPTNSPRARWEHCAPGKNKTRCELTPRHPKRPATIERINRFARSATCKVNS